MCTLTLDDDVRCPIAVFHTVVERSTTFIYTGKAKDQILFLVTNPSLLAIGDNFIGFSASCVSHDFLLKHFLQTLDVSERSMSHKLFGYFLQRLMFGVCEH